MSGIKPEILSIISDQLWLLYFDWRTFYSSVSWIDESLDANHFLTLLGVRRNRNRFAHLILATSIEFNQHFTRFSWSNWGLDIAVRYIHKSFLHLQ